MTNYRVSKAQSLRMRAADMKAEAAEARKAKAAEKKKGRPTRKPVWRPQVPHQRFN
jgi:hypothetical protein